MLEPTTGLSISILLPVSLRALSAHDIMLVRRALESIHDQRYPDAYEIIIVDDGNTVPFRDIAPMVGPSYLHRARVVRSWRDNGLVHALNVGLIEAQYSWIARLGIDDRWFPTKIEKQISQIQNDPDLSICATGMTLVESSEHPYESHLRSGCWSDILRFFIEGGCPFPHAGILARRDIFRLLGGYPHDLAVSHCEDYALWGTWLRFFKPGMVEDLPSGHTVSGESESGLYRDQQARASETVCRRLARLGVADILPSALNGLAKVVGCSLLDAGKLAYSMWRFGPAVRLPEAVLPFLEAILPDRQVMQVNHDDAFEPEQIILSPSRLTDAGGICAVRAGLSGMRRMD